MEKPAADGIEPRQAWEMDLFRPEDAPGVARLFRLVYGDGYPVKTFTDPERLIEENAAGLTISNVARTPQGDIVGHSALYQSAPFPGLYESGATLTAPNYRGGVLGVRLIEYSIKKVAPQFGIATIFGEVVCNHIAMQKISAMMKFVPCALEVDLMPAEAYAQEGSASGRVAALMFFDIISPQPQMIQVPGAYAEMVNFIYSGIKHECRFVPSSRELPGAQETRVETQIFDFAKVARFTVQEVGADFASVFDKAENAARQQGAIVLQVWLQLSWPWVGRAVDLLRSRGYFAGGVLPRWLDVDGLLLQKVIGPPHWDGIQVFGERAGRILEMVRADWATTHSQS
ncbi:MAG: GNAT family N-acetyltransferase [Desulfobaccales bacterium]